MATVTPAQADPLVGLPTSSPWLLRLNAPDPEARAGAAWLLGRYTPDEDRDNLAGPLGQALTQEDDPRVMMALVGALSVGDAPSQGRVLRSFFSTEGRLAAAGIPTTVGAAAIRALGQHTDEETLWLLIRTARVGAAGVLRTDLSEAAALALADEPDGAFSTAITLSNLPRATSQDRAALLYAVGLRGDARNARLVYEQLVGSGRPGTLPAIEATVQLGLVEHAPALVTLARNARDRTLRRAAVRALGSLGGGFDSASLRELMADPVTRDVALGAAGALGDAARVTDVALYLDAAWSADRISAAEALGAIGGDAAAQALARAIPREREGDVREALWHGLARAGGSLAIEALEAAPDEAGAHWARVELALRGGARVRATATGDGTAATRVRAWREGARTQGLSSASADVRAATAAALGDARTGSESLATRLLREDDEGVRVAIVLALGAVNDAVAREALVDLVARECEDPTLAAVAAAEAVGEGAMSGAAPSLRRMATTGASARAVARWASGVLHDPAAIGALEVAAVTEPDVLARGAAVIALARVWGASAEGAVRAAQRTAWNTRLDAMVNVAQTISRGGDGGRMRGTAVARLAGAPPRSVWAVEMPDGAMRFGVAAEDGVVMIAGVPSARSPLRRVD